MRTRIAQLLLVLGLVAAATVAAAPAQAGPLCSVTYQVSPFPGGFTGFFTVINNSTTTTKGWRVEVHFHDGVDVVANWNSEILLDAAPVYVFGNAAFNGVLRPGASTGFGVNALKSSASVPNTPRSAVCAPLF